MAKQKKQSLNKKPIVAIVIGLVVAAAIGATIAYRGDIARFFNQATLGESGATFTEEFVSPDNWKPCDTQPKTIIATNTTNKPTPLWKNSFIVRKIAVQTYESFLNPTKHLAFLKTSLIFFNEIHAIISHEP